MFQAEIVQSGGAQLGDEPARLVDRPAQELHALFQLTLFGARIAAAPGLGTLQMLIRGHDELHQAVVEIEGYLAAFREHGLAADDTLIKIGTLQSTWGSVAALDLLRLPAPPTALFVASNSLVPGVMHTLRSQRIAVPDEVSLICFDDVEWFALTVPTVTAVSSSHARLADAAVTLLLSRVEDPDQRWRPPVVMEIGFELVLRNSTAAPRTGPLILRGTQNG